MRKGILFAFIVIVLTILFSPQGMAVPSVTIMRQKALDVIEAIDAKRAAEERREEKALEAIVAEEPIPEPRIDEEDWAFHVGTHLRTSFNTLANTVDLNKEDPDDCNYYMGYAYDFTFDVRHLSGMEIYAFIERRGRADYDAPLWGEKGLNTLFGRYRWYREENVFPHIRELWIEWPLTPARDLRFKCGLFPYGREVGHKIALGGKYENYGVSLSGDSEAVDWNLHWEVEDYSNRIHLGKVPNFDIEKNEYDVESAYFTAADATYKLGGHRIQGYFGWLRDYTSSNARDNKFATRVKEENLFTAGTYVVLNIDRLSLGFEGARNFGKAESVTDTRDDVEHRGYLIIADASYDLGSFKPKCKFFLASGNEINESNNTFSITSDTNDAFSVFSPLNVNLTDSHYQKQFGPYVAMAGGYAVNFGVARPGTFGDPFLFENIVAYTVGFDYTPMDKVYVGVDYWYLHSKEPGHGLDSAGRAEKFSRDLGQEIDIFASYQLTPNIKLSLLGGYFFPGDYYKVGRMAGESNAYSPTPRRDGDADGAYQLELGMDVTF